MNTPKTRAEMCWGVTRNELDALRQEHAIPPQFEAKCKELMRWEIEYALRGRTASVRFVNSACLAITAFSVAMAPLLLVVSLACFVTIPLIPFGIIGLAFVMVIRGSRRNGIEVSLHEAERARYFLALQNSK